MPEPRKCGFTLIELLTVIAIIAILAGMVMAGAPRLIERARISSYMQTCNSIRVACVNYFTKNRDTYPPGYGFVVYGADEEASQAPDETGLYYLVPYMAKLDMFRNFDAYDYFAQDSYDTDRDGTISFLEYLPIGVPSRTNVNVYDFPVFRYNGNLAQPVNPTMNPGRTFADEIREAKEQQRPLAYIPVNMKQYQRVADYYYKMAKTAATARRGWYMEGWDQEKLFPNMGNRIPVPAKYDNYVLISVGPALDTGGILTPPRPFMSDLEAKVDPMYWYHVLAMRAYWLATRDANANGQLDFDYRNRTRGREDDPASYENASWNLNLLPNGTNGAGPLIYRPNQ